MNNKGQFSVIAALLVAVVLVAAVAVTYSSIRYDSSEEQPQILSSIDETNLGLKELLGFTVGYYGSVLKVTGNMTYAQQLAQNYLQSGLNNIGNVRPELGASVNLVNLTLKAEWFSNQSYSEGAMYVNYNLTGKGIYSASYNGSARLDVQIQDAPAADKAKLVILRDEAEPLLNLGKNNLKIYQYDYAKSAWNLVSPTEIAAYANGTYILDLPDDVTSDAYSIEVSDTRGLMVEAASFTQYKSTVNWDSTPYRLTLDYADESNPIVGTQSDFAAEQNGPDGITDTLTEAAYGLGTNNYYPLSVNLLGSTSISQWSGNVTDDTDTNDGSYLQLRSYASAFSGSAALGYQTKGYSTVNIENQITGSLFTTEGGGEIHSVTVYLYSTASSQNHNAKVAIYQASDDSLVASSNERKISPGENGWITFTFSDPKPQLSADTDYVLVAWANGWQGSVYMYYDSGSPNQGYSDSQTYGNWPDPNYGLNPNSNRQYSIYCTYNQGSEYTVQAELSGTSDSIDWEQLTWALDSATTVGTVNYTLQLYNFGLSQYPTSGDGYQTTTLGTTDTIQTQTITTNPADYRNTSLGWRILLTAYTVSADQFDLKIDLAHFAAQFTNYALNIQEQWLNVDPSYQRQDLCIKTGALGTEGLQVQVLDDTQWVNLMTLLPNFCNNISLAPYINSETLAIRFVGENDVSDPTPDSYVIDCVYIKDEPNIEFLVNQQQSTFTVEVLQNGTMRWLGQNLNVTTSTVPIPPVPVKSIHINQTIGGVNKEVPFQIEDWASNYQIPLGLTSNTTVFSNRQMIVFLMDSSVSEFSIWWNASDAAVQTSTAYTPIFFKNDNLEASIYTNGNLTLQFLSGTVKATVAETSTYSTATFMRVNSEASSYGAGTSLVIHHGIVRDIAMQESEWGRDITGIGGADGCPNIYANIIIMLPANSTYYNYQLRLMFISSSQARSLTDLCPIKLTTSVVSPELQAENGTIADFPVVVNGSATYPNYASVGYTAHHFMQYITDSGKGAGLMQSDVQNLLLYAFDGFPSSTSIGAIKTAASGLELLPVASGLVQFTYAYDVTWKGAVATFDGNTPICNFYDATTAMGLWILSEYPPTITIAAQS